MRYYQLKANSKNMAISSTQNKLWLVSIDDPTQRLGFQFVPNELGFKRDAGVEDVKIIARNEPQYQTGGGKSTLNLVIDFYATDQNNRDVWERCEWLRGTNLSDGVKSRPHRFKLIWGAMYQDEEFIVGDVDIKVHHFDEKNNFMPLRATANIALFFHTVKKRSDLWR